MKTKEPTPRDFFVGSLMELIRIDTTNPLNSITVQKLTKNIPQNEFSNFIASVATRSNDYQKPIEIIAKGVREFEKIRIEQLKSAGLEFEVRALVDRCRKVVRAIDERAPKGFNTISFSHNASWENFPNTFTDEEKYLLDAVGGCKRWILEHYENSFFEDLLSHKIKKTITYSRPTGITYKKKEQLVLSDVVRRAS